MCTARSLPLCLLLFAVCCSTGDDVKGESMRVATYNIAMYRDRAGQLADDLRRGDDEQALSHHSSARR